MKLKIRASLTQQNRSTFLCSPKRKLTKTSIFFLHRFRKACWSWLIKHERCKEKPQPENRWEISRPSISLKAYFILDDQMPISNLSKQNFRNSSQKGLLNTSKNKKKQKKTSVCQRTHCTSLELSLKTHLIFLQLLWKLLENYPVH